MRARGQEDKRTRGQEDTRTKGHEDTMTGFQDKMIQGSYATKLKFCPATHSLTRVETCQVHAV